MAYYLINDQDNSVNHFQDTAHPEFMKGSTTYEVQYDIDSSDLSDEDKEDIFMLFWDKEAEKLIPNAMKLVKMTKAELQEWIDEQQLLAQAVSKANDTDKYNKLVNLLKQLYPDNPAIDEILTDENVTQDELAEIETMLNS